MYRTATILSLVLSTGLVSAVRAEKANLSPAQLREIATHVVTGKVTAIYQRTEKQDNWEYDRYVAEIKVDQCEKGDGIEKGDLVYVRYWRRGWIGPGRVPPSTAGHRGLPSDSDSLRIYLARNAYDGFTRENNDGGYNVIGANGFEPSK